jgi:hypothetical protein
MAGVAQISAAQISDAVASEVPHAPLRSFQLREKETISRF